MGWLGFIGMAISKMAYYISAGQCGNFHLGIGMKKIPISWYFTVLQITQ